MARKFSASAMPEVSIHSPHGQQLCLNLSKREIPCADKNHTLKPTPCRLLYLLAQHPNQVVSRAAIFREVWGYEFDPGTKIIEVQICYLRNILAVLSPDFTIRTIRGRGFSLCPLPSEAKCRPGH